ncbi:hypothetical protein ACFLWA_01890 [Chloroflexota bacterium]
MTDVRSLRRPILNAGLRLLGKALSLGRDATDTIIVASSPRGGSTWLAEVIGTLPGYPMLFEPLNVNRNPECEEYGFTWQTYVPPGADEPQKREYLEQVFTGRNLSTRLVTRRHFSAGQFLRLRGYLPKFTNANLLLYWMLEQFPVRAVLMIRHPCAVVSSQLRHGGWDVVTKENLTLPAGIESSYSHLRDLHERIESQEEALALEWATQTYIPLSQLEPHPWYLTTYERLLTDGPDELDRIFNYLGVSPPEQAFQQLRIPSGTARPDSDIARGQASVSGWRERLTSAQVERIMKVVREAGIDFYDDGPLPDYEKLGLP